MKKIKITLGFCAMACILAWLHWELCACFLLCSFVHELGHLATMKLCAVKVRQIRVCICGAVIEAEFSSYGKEIICAAAGPLAGLVLSAVLMRLLPTAAIVSAALSLFNLLPLLNLDGGRILRSALYRTMEQTAADKLLNLVAAIVSCLLMVLACWAAVYLQMGLWPIFAALAALCRVSGSE